jgi:hypothetical protein
MPAPISRKLGAGYFRGGALSNFLFVGPRHWLIISQEPADRSLLPRRPSCAEHCRPRVPHGPIPQLRILTGQRKTESAHLRQQWINTKDRTITLPD